MVLAENCADAPIGAATLVSGGLDLHDQSAVATLQSMARAGQHVVPIDVETHAVDVPDDVGIVDQLMARRPWPRSAGRAIE